MCYTNWFWFVRLLLLQPIYLGSFLFLLLLHTHTISRSNNDFRDLYLEGTKLSNCILNRILIQWNSFHRIQSLSIIYPLVNVITSQALLTPLFESFDLYGWYPISFVQSALKSLINTKVWFDHVIDSLESWWFWKTWISSRSFTYHNSSTCSLLWWGLYSIHSLWSFLAKEDEPHSFHRSTSAIELDDFTITARKLRLVSNILLVLFHGNSSCLVYSEYLQWNPYFCVFTYSTGLWFSYQSLPICFHSSIKEWSYVSSDIFPMYWWEYWRLSRYIYWFHPDAEMCFSIVFSL